MYAETGAVFGLCCQVARPPLWLWMSLSSLVMLMLEKSSPYEYSFLEKDFNRLG